MSPACKLGDGMNHSLQLPERLQRSYDLATLLRPPDPFSRTASELRLCDPDHGCTPSGEHSGEHNAIDADHGCTPKLFKDPCSLPAASRSGSWLPLTSRLFGKVDEIVSHCGWDDVALPTSPFASLHPQTLALIKHVSADDSITHDTYISGSIVLSGNFQEHTATICDALRVALLTVASPLVGCDLVLTVWRGIDCAASNGDVEVLEKNTEGNLTVDFQSHVKFSFEGIVMDPFLNALVLEALHFEATTAGAQKLLPALTVSLGDVVQRLTTRLEIDA